MRKSETTAFADEADLSSVVPEDPATEPDYWLETYPVMMQALAAKEDDPPTTPEDVALGMAILTILHCSGGIFPTDSETVQMYVKEHIAVG